ncbi:MAG: hypothetical protein GX825_03080 [Syntrophomonadaceae bacterium]|nr:hypothetical protein [Syntrophomonadaceae bacterium]
MDLKKILMLALISSGIVMGASFAVIHVVADYSPNLAQVDSQIVTDSEMSDNESPAQQVIEEQTLDTNCSSFLSPQETKEVQDMLTELGFGKTTLADSITAFREQNVMKPNQYLLDNTVLESIISQLSLQKAQSFGLQ